MRPGRISSLLSGPIPAILTTSGRQLNSFHPAGYPARPSLIKKWQEGDCCNKSYNAGMDIIFTATIIVFHCFTSRPRLIQQRKLFSSYYLNTWEKETTPLKVNKFDKSGLRIIFYWSEKAVMKTNF